VAPSVAATSAPLLSDAPPSARPVSMATPSAPARSVAESGAVLSAALASDVIPSGPARSGAVPSAALPSDAIPSGPARSGAAALASEAPDPARSSPPSVAAGRSAANAASVPCAESGLAEGPSMVGPPPSAPLPANESAGIESVPASPEAARRDVLEHPANASRAEIAETAHRFRALPRLFPPVPGADEAVSITQDSVLQLRPPRLSVISATHSPPARRAVPCV
jgi:hypothetical protein